MILTKLIVEGFGPFHFPTEIFIDSEVTVLTGQNDVGKSALLRLIYLMCSNENAIQEDANVDRTYRATTPWNKDTGIKCTATFTLNENLKLYQNNNFAPGTEVTVDFFLRANHRSITSAHHKAHQRQLQDGSIISMPSIVTLPQKEELSSTIDSNTSNSLEVSLLNLAFGQNYKQKLESLDQPRQRTELRAANKRINDLLRELLPSSLELEIVIDIFKDESLKFSLNLLDTQGADTPVHMRGQGVRKILTLLVLLMTLYNEERNRYIYVLFDEPETSLHADSQHLLRRLLEKLGANKYIQVIYATHSPSMINSMRPETIRLLSRSQRNGIATTVVNNRPINEDFLPVRVSLGITASDSLLYSPITVIVEGITEVLSLPLLMQRLCKEKNEEFQEVNNFLSLSHFLDGQGSSFEYLCRLSKSQGCKPIIFVDGDKLREIKKLKIEEKHPEVPIIVLKDGTEFEDIVPHEIYFEALEESFALSDLYIDYQAWLEEKKLPTQMMFSKRVNNFMVDRFPQLAFDKSEIMRRAIAKANLDKIDLEEIRQLIMVSKTLL